MKYYHTVKKFNRRAILSGKVIELYEYEKPVVIGTSNKRVGRAGFSSITDEIKMENRKKTASRARRLVRNTVNANPHLDKFLTLTFAKNLTDLTKAHYEFDKFIKRLKTRCKGFQYIEVVEFQKRGAVHFHILCNLPYINVNELAQIWGNGYIKINRIDNVDNVGAYITKYMTKDNVDERLAGRKCYSMSKNLNRPKEYTSERDIDELMENTDSVKRIFSTEFESEYYGIVRYTQIICMEKPTPPNRFRKWFNRFKAHLTLMPDYIPCPFD